MTALDQHAEEPRWVAWRNERRGDKLTKVPYCATDKKAKADDPATWLCRAEAERVAAKIVNGLGGGVGYEASRTPGNQGFQLRGSAMAPNTAFRGAVIPASAT